MSRRLLVASAVTMLATSPLGAQVPPGEIQSLAWMSGTWAGEKDGVAMEELWTTPRGGALLGIHRDVKGDRLVVKWATEPPQEMRRFG